MHFSTKLAESTVYAATSVASLFGVAGIAQADLSSVDKIASLGALGTIAAIAISLWIRSEWKRDEDRKSSDATREKLTETFVAKQEAMTKEFTAAIERNTTALNANTTAVHEVASLREIMDAINNKPKH